MAQSWLERAQRAEQKERGSASLPTTITPQQSETSKSTRDNGSSEPDRR